MSSPTQRTLAELRRLGYLAAVTERWNPHAHIRQDLFGIVDVLAVGPFDLDEAGFLVVPMCDEPADTFAPQHTLAVQATSNDGGNVTGRVAKLKASPSTALLIAAGWRVEVWGWRKSAKTKRWELRREAL